ncbi:protein of unknown function [Candidatus Nitrosotalea okcheonensis]|uniref:Uncharacterized protein n=1 Tax=Candidatus Nitrosotalea okcheonensis TaxID=1903276 RepID=A0A2H1FDA8_9ARCH|nr:protein of unknown function [Candidatus Nitrosotalea okcheonensis]
MIIRYDSSRAVLIFGRLEITDDVCDGTVKENHVVYKTLSGPNLGPPRADRRRGITGNQ